MCHRLYPASFSGTSSSSPELKCHLPVVGTSPGCSFDIFIASSTWVLLSKWSQCCLLLSPLGSTLLPALHSSLLAGVRLPLLHHRALWHWGPLKPLPNFCPILSGFKVWLLKESPLHILLQILVWGICHSILLTSFFSLRTVSYFRSTSTGSLEGTAYGLYTDNLVCIQHRAWDIVGAGSQEMFEMSMHSRSWFFLGLAIDLWRVCQVLYLWTLPVCKNMFVYLSCVCVCTCLHEFMCTVCVQGPMETRRGHRIPLELELQAFMSCHGVSHVSFNQHTDVVIDLDFVFSCFHLGQPCYLPSTGLLAGVWLPLLRQRALWCCGALLFLIRTRTL